MNINLNTSSLAIQGQTQHIGRSANPDAKGNSFPSTDNALRVVNNSQVVPQDEVSADVEASITRNDALGIVFSQAFTLSPPPLPEFKE